MFLVPLSPSGFALGVVVRTNRKGSVFGYFFGPRLDSPTLPATLDISPAVAIMVCRFGDHGLYNNKWHSVGQLANWNRSEWLMPRFWRKHDNATKIYITEYDDSLHVVAENIVSRTAIDMLSLVPDEQLGSAIVEARLSSFFNMDVSCASQAS